LSLDHIWITAHGRAVLLDEPWPVVGLRAERFSVEDLVGQQRFLNAIAICVESTTLPLHARPMLQNLEDGKFEKLSFFAGTLRGLLDKPASVSKGVRAGSIFMIPLYVWIMGFVGVCTGEGAQALYGSVEWIALFSAVSVLGAIAVIQILELLFRTTASHEIFRLAVVNASGEPASLSRLLARWAIVWLPLFLPLLSVAMLMKPAASLTFICALVTLFLWIGAVVYSVIRPYQGLHDLLAGTRVVRH
jgi:hypothetical protein